MLRGKKVPWTTVRPERSTMKVLSTWMIMCGTMWLAESFIFDLDLKLDSALQKGGTLSRNTGSYLYDSFRTEIVAPAFNAVVKELRANRRSDVITEGILFMLILVLGSLMLVLWLKTKKKSDPRDPAQAPV